MNLFVSYLVMTLQLLTGYCCYHAITSEISFSYVFIIICLSYLLTDFVNGLIHMYMDNNDNYHSIVGPFVANFHMHHKKLKYSYNNACAVYFYESGFKIWLPFFLSILCVFQLMGILNFYVNLMLTSFGILSSFAEVSHYWCHRKNENSKIIKLLQNYYILLPTQHHRHHHLHDNTQYAFLNGVTDPILNLIAKRFFKGYKQKTDLHAEII